MTSFSIILGTYGDVSWREQAEKLAIDTVNMQDYDGDRDIEVVQYHGDTLAQARNRAAEDASGDYLIFLDTGDLLDIGYVAAMDAASGDIRRPSVRGFDQQGFIDPQPVMSPRPESLIVKNFIVIGAAVNRRMFLDVRGFSEIPVLEDWELWLKLVCYLGATVVDVPEAVYLINDSHDRSKHPHDAIYASRIRQTFARYGARV